MDKAQEVLQSAESQGLDGFEAWPFVLRGVIEEKYLELWIVAGAQVLHISFVIILLPLASDAF